MTHIKVQGGVWIGKEDGTQGNIRGDFASIPRVVLCFPVPSGRGSKVPAIDLPTQAGPLGLYLIQYAFSSGLVLVTGGI